MKNSHLKNSFLHCDISVIRVYVLSGQTLFENFHDAKNKLQTRRSFFSVAGKKPQRNSFLHRYEKSNTRNENDSFSFKYHHHTSYNASIPVPVPTRISISYKNHSTYRRSSRARAPLINKPSQMSDIHDGAFNRAFKSLKNKRTPRENDDSLKYGTFKPSFSSNRPLAKVA